MTRTDQQALTISVFLHGLVLVVAVAVGVFENLFEREPPQVLQLVDLSRMGPPQPMGPALPDPLPESPPEEVPPISVAELDALEVPLFEAIREVPQIHFPEPEPPPPPPKPVPTPQPQAAPRPEPRKVTFDQHRREHGAPTPTPARPARPTPVVAPRIESNAREALMRTIGEATLHTSPAYSDRQQDALRRYVSSVVTQLRQHFHPPGSTGLTAWVRFTVEPDGTFRDVHIQQSSGNPAFDAAVLAAFRSLRKGPALPVREAVTWTVDFRHGN